MVQLSYPYMTIGKTKALTGWIFVSKVMALHFHTLSRFVMEASLIAQLVKNLPAVQETLVPFLGQEVSLEKE